MWYKMVGKVNTFNDNFYLWTAVDRSIARYFFGGRKVRATESTILPNGKISARVF